MDDALTALRNLTTCRCDPAWTERKLHAPDCLEEYREEVDELDSALASLTTERDRLREELAIAHASERAALAAEAGRATPIVAGWDRMQRALATIPDLAAERDTAQALLVEEQRDHAVTREERDLAFQMRNETMAALKRMRQERDDAEARTQVCCERNRPELERRRLVGEAARLLIEAEHAVEEADVDTGQHDDAVLERDQAWDDLVDAVAAVDALPSPTPGNEDHPRGRN